MFFQVGVVRKELILQILQTKLKRKQNYQLIFAQYTVYVIYNASILANSGELDPYALQYLMTRSSQKVTARYITPKNERLIKVANVMEKEVNKILNRSQNG